MGSEAYPLANRIFPPHPPLKIMSELISFVYAQIYKILYGKTRMGQYEKPNTRFSHQYDDFHKTRYQSRMQIHFLLINKYDKAFGQILIS